MERQQFQGYNCDLGEIQKCIEIYFAGKGYRVTNFHKDSIYLTQAYKNELMGKCILSKIVGSYTNFDISIGIGEQIKNIANLPAAFEKIPLQTKLLLREPLLENNFWNYVLTKAELKRNTYGISKPNLTEQPMVWREREVVREIEVVYCRYCGAKNNARLTTCNNCNAHLH